MELSKDRIDGVIRVAKAMLKRLGIKGTADWANNCVSVNIVDATKAQKLQLMEESEMFVATQGVRIVGNFF